MKRMLAGLRLGRLLPPRETFASAWHRQIFVLSPLLVVGAWQLLCATHLFPAMLLPSPRQVFVTLLELWSDATLPAAIGSSLIRLGLGYLLGASVGLVLGAAFGLLPAFQRRFGLCFDMVRHVPTVSLVPLFILVFGIQESFKIAMIAFAAFSPVALNTRDGFRCVGTAYIEVAKVLRLGHWSVLRYLMFPAALPAIVTGLRLALSRSWMILVAAELFASNDGLGHLMDSGRQFFQLDVVMAAVVVAAAIGFVLDVSLKAGERCLSHWNSTDPAGSRA